MIRQPSNDDSGAWIYYWRKVGQGWRREPEIGIERQQYLSYQINASGNLPVGMRMPFDGIILHRGDIEWLVATYPGRKMDLQGAILRRQDVSCLESNMLAMLTLHDTIRAERPKYSQEEMNGLQLMELDDLTRVQSTRHEIDVSEERNGSTVAPAEDHDPKAKSLLEAYESGERDFSDWDLAGAYLKTACLREANLTRANLRAANLSCADLSGATLVDADLSGTDMSFATLTAANMSGANLCSTVMRSSNLTKVDFRRADLTNAQMQRARWEGADFEGSIRTGVVWADPSPTARPLWNEQANEQARPISSDDYIGEWWSRDRDS